MAYTESEFNIAGNKVESSVSEAQKQDLNAIVAGDMNCNPSDSNSSRTVIFIHKTQTHLFQNAKKNSIFQDRKSCPGEKNCPGEKAPGQSFLVAVLK